MKRALDRLFPSVGRKIVVAVAAGLLVAGGAFVYFAQRTGYMMLEQQAQAKARGVAGIMQGILEHAMLEGQPGHVRHALAEAAASPEVADAFFVREDGSVTLSAHAQNDSLPIGAFAPTGGVSGSAYLSRQEGGSLYEIVLTPVVKEPACLRCHPGPSPTNGYFGLKVRMDDLRALAGGHRTTNIVMTVVTFTGLGVIILLALSVLVVKPIGRLHSHIREIEGKMSGLKAGERHDIPLLAEPETSDEIADLCRDFNRLIERLNDADTKIHTLHRIELEAADRLASVGRLAASMAHEIKNPIAGVLGALQIFDGETPPTDPKKEILAEMMIQLDRVTHAVNDLLSYARPAPPLLEEILPLELVEKTIRLLGPHAKGIALPVECRDPAAVIRADRKQFQQLIWNILLNGIQSIDREGCVRTTIAPEGRSLVVTVADNGRGMTPEQLAEVFTPFYTTKHKGTGLGMTICRTIVEQHNGTIDIASGPGKGTTVRIALPSAGGGR